MADPNDWTLTALKMKLGNLRVTVPANKIEAFRARGYVAEGEPEPAPVPPEPPAPCGCC